MKTCKVGFFVFVYRVSWEHWWVLGVQEVGRRWCTKVNGAARSYAETTSTQSRSGSFSNPKPKHIDLIIQPTLNPKP